MKRFGLIGLMVVACLVTVGSGATAQRGLQVCTWGGTPAAPTGELTIARGLTVTPASSAIPFSATGTLAGGGRCHGTMTFDGLIRAGSTCAHTWFDGRVKGLPGVASFSGPGVANVVHEFLYDHQGRIVGADQPVVQVPQPEGYSHAQDCAGPDGFTRGVFSSLVELWG